MEVYHQATHPKGKYQVTRKPYSKELVTPPAADTSGNAGSTPPRPHFSAGTVVDAPAMIVDNYGTAWWVDPHAKEVRLA
jgi:hypothetical protein